MNISQEILSDIVVYNKYAKYLPTKQRRETWKELVTRNKKMHQAKFPNLKEEIEDVYKLVYDKKVLPSMRSLQFAGKPIDINNSRIFNCSFLPIDDWRSFSEVMFLLLSGCGVGYSVQNHHIDKLPEIRIPKKQRRETWKELVTRNKKMHQSKYPDLKEDIEDVYKMVYDKKVLPSMRSLQFAGKPIDINNSRIFNCSYLPIDDWRSFSEVMFLLLSGCGVGYSVQHHHIEKLPEIRIPKKTRRFLVGDSIEGWADSVKVLLKSYFGITTARPIFDFRDIRPKGAELITVGGKAPGPEPLKECLFQIQ